MREDEQRFEFEELESKLAALSSQVESLRLEKEIDPFFEDDVRRLIEDFREREIDAGLDEEPEGFDDQQELQNSDYISVVRTEDPSFKVHWITPESCDEMTKEKAKEAFAIGAASRYGTSQQVRGGDVLILLCRKPIPEEPESSESSEPEPVPPPSEFCHYIGMAVNTFVGPSSAEPEPTPDPDSEELIAKKFGNFEIFVWSSCECSSEPASTVVIPSVFETGSSSSSSHGNYASIGGSASPDMSSADGLLTSAEIRKDNATGAVKLAKGLSNTLTISTQNAGYKTELVQLSQDLTEYYLDRKTKNLSFDADKKELNKHGFASDIFTSKSLTLSNGDCGNLEAVSISGETFDIALLKEGGASLGSTFLTTAKISLGAAVSLGDSLAIETYQSLTGVIESNNTLEDEHTVFLPIVSDTDADTILETDSITHKTLSLGNPVVTGDGENFRVSIGTVLKSEKVNFVSGLFLDKISISSTTGSLIFDIPDREVSIADLLDLDNKQSIHKYPITELENIRAISSVPAGLIQNHVPIKAKVHKVKSLFGGGLYESSENIPGVTSVSLGSITLPRGADGPVSIASGLNISGDKTVSGDGVTLSTNFSWDQYNSNFLYGLYKDTDDVENMSAAVDFQISLGDLTSLGKPGPAGHYLKELSNLRASGNYNTDGSLTLELELDALRSQLKFTDHGLYNSEISEGNVSLSSGSISIAPMSIGTFPDIGAKTTNNLLTQISGISSTEDTTHNVSGEKKLNLSGTLGGKTYTFDKGILTGVGSFNSTNVSLGSLIIPDSSASTSGTSSNYTPTLFKTGVTSGTSAEFYQKSVSIFSSSNALIDFVNGVAVSLNNPSYSYASSLDIDASNNSGTAEVTKLTDISVRGEYDVIYEDEGTGDARYYVDYTYESVSLTIQNGLVTSSVSGSSTIETEGPIIVPGTEIRYGCHPTYGCQLDAAGEYTEPSCGGGCTAEELILSYRPAGVWVYEQSSFDDGEVCYNFISEHEITEPAAPLENDLANQYYTNNGHYKAELDGSSEQIDNFYVNGSLISRDQIFFAEKDYSELCYEHTYKPDWLHLYRYANDTTEANGVCSRFISEHQLIPAQSTDRLLVYTGGLEVLLLTTDDFKFTVSRYSLNGETLVLTNGPGTYNPVPASGPWTSTDPYYVSFGCFEASEIDFTASGGQAPYIDSIDFAETEGAVKTSVSVKYADINNSTGSSTRFYDSLGTELVPLESYVNATGDESLNWTIEIPSGSTSLTVEQNNSGSPGSSNWTLDVKAI